MKLSLLFLRLALVCALGLAPLAASAAEPATAPLRSIEAVQQLPLAMARLGVPVQLEGVVLFHDAEESLLVLASEDGTQQIIAETGRGNLSMAAGQRVSVEGTTGFFLGNLGVTGAKVSLLAGTRPLTAETATLEGIVQGKHNHRYVEFEAVVTMLRSVRNRGSLHVHGLGGQVNVAIRDLNAEDPALAAYQDALIRVRGVVVPYSQSAEGPNQYRLVASQRAEIEMLEIPPEQPFEVTATPVGDAPPFTTCCRIRVQGRVVQAASAKRLTLEDETGRIEVQLRTPTELRPGDWADVVAYPTLEADRSVLEHGLARLLAPPLSPPPSSEVPTPVSRLIPVLRDIAEVLKLSPEEAARGLPVRLRGQLTYHLPGRYLHLRAGNRGIEAGLPAGLVTVPEDLRPGQIVELDARTVAGEFNPKLVATQLAVLGEGSLPPATEFRHGALASGQHDGNWVGVRGVVRAARRDGPSVALDVATAGGRFTAIIPADTNAPALLGLVDAGVYVRGICQVIANPRRQAIGFRLLVPRSVDLTVQKPPPSDPFSLPLLQVVNLFRYNPDVLPGHRVRVRGIVTLQRRAESFWLRDESGGIGVRPHKPEMLEPGEILEVVGFPSLLDNRPYIHDPLIRRIGKTNPPAPLALSPQQALEGNHSGEWVSMTGRILEVLHKNESPALVLESDRHIFQALYMPTNPPGSLRQLQAGDSVRVNGVCLVKLDEEGVPRSFQVLADSPAQLEILQRAPWLNPRRALLAALLLSAIVLAAATWVMLLRRQVRKQTSLVRDLNANLERRVAERTSELEAANRELESFSYSVSHDLRGPLRAVNGFAEILLQTHAGQLDERGSRYLRQVAEGGRRMGRLVDDLLTFSRLGRQPVNRAQVDLHLLARRAVDELQRQHPQRQVEVILHPLPPVHGDRPLLEQVLVNLLGNAWKFTARQPAARIEMGASAQGGQPLYFVRDNGAGFDMKYADKLFGVFQRLHPEDEFPGTGVGLAIVQRIIHRHGGHIWAQASPGQGATFYFTLPSGNPAPAAEPAQAFGK